MAGDNALYVSDPETAEVLKNLDGKVVDLRNTLQNDQLNLSKGMDDLLERVEQLSSLLRNEP